MTTRDFKFTDAQVSRIINHLAKSPYLEVHDLIHSFQLQASNSENKQGVDEKPPPG